MSGRAPYVELSAMARVEAHRKNVYRPPYYVHKWWARRLGSVFRGIALDMLLPEDEDVMDAYYRAHDFSDIVVLDPFMGGGTTVGEALRLGCKVVGCDLNPVAWYLVSQAMRQVDTQALTQSFQQVADEVAQPITDMYRTVCGGCGRRATAQYTGWVKQVPCGECGALSSLHLNNVIMADMATKGAGLVDCPGCGHVWWVPAVRCEVQCPDCAHAFVAAERRTKNTHYQCDVCGHSDRILSAIGATNAPPTHRMRHVFAHHAFIPAKEPLEANLWGVHRSSGGFATLFKERMLRGQQWADAPMERRFSGSKAEKVPIPGERLAGRPAKRFEQLRNDEADMLLLNQSSESLDQVPDGSIDLVITDPPFADNVMYSELSDYFYVWLRLALSDHYQNFSTPSVDDSREAVHNPGRGRDGAFYTTVLGNVLAEAARKLKPGGKVAFTFHHSGENAWRHIEDALVFAGLVVERWWPVFAEMESSVPLHGKENNGHLDIVFVCAKAGEISRPSPQADIAQMGRNLAKRVMLVAADYRALIEAARIQQDTWQRSALVRKAA